MEELLELGFRDVSLDLEAVDEIGVYVLVWRGEIMYVGATTEPLERVRWHNSDKRFDGVFFLECNWKKLKELETRMIDKLEPRLNRPRVQLRLTPKEESARRRREYAIEHSTSIKVGGTYITLRKKKVGGGIVVG